MLKRLLASRLVMAVFVTAGAMTASRAAVSPGAPGAPATHDALPIVHLSVSQAMLAATRGEVLLVDVRPSAQRALGHIRGDVHIPLEQLAARQAELPKGRRLVFYCSCHAEELALDAVRILRDAGNSQAEVLVGGYDEWRAADGPIQVDGRWDELFRVNESPAGWGKTPVDTARCQYTRDAGVAAHGNASGRMTFRPGPTTRGFAGYSQKLDASALQGRKVTLSAMVRSEDVQRGAYVWIGAEDAQGRMTIITDPRADLITGTQDWHHREASATVPSTAVRLVIGVTLTAAGQLWLDDFHLVAAAEPGLPALQPLIANYSFEE